MTLADAERILSQGEFTKQQEKEICDSIFLTREDISELLDHVQLTAKHTFLYHPCRRADEERLLKEMRRITRQEPRFGTQRTHRELAAELQRQVA